MANPSTVSGSSSSRTKGSERRVSFNPQYPSSTKSLEPAWVSQSVAATNVVSGPTLTGRVRITVTASAIPAGTDHRGGVAMTFAKEGVTPTDPATGSGSEVLDDYIGCMQSRVFEFEEPTEVKFLAHVAAQYIAVTPA